MRNYQLLLALAWIMSSCSFLPGESFLKEKKQESEKPLTQMEVVEPQPLEPEPLEATNPIPEPDNLKNYFEPAPGKKLKPKSYSKDKQEREVCINGTLWRWSCNTPPDMKKLRP